MNVPLAAPHSAAVLLGKHCPDTKQHAPLGGCGHNVGLQTANSLCGTPPCAVQVVAKTVVQLPLAGKQHARGKGQSPETQSVNAPWYSPLAFMHRLREKGSQVPLGRQHAPVGNGEQSAFEQVGKRSSNGSPPWAMQAASVRSAHEVLGKQHAPIAGQIDGMLQAVSSPPKVPPSAKQSVLFRV